MSRFFTSRSESIEARRWLQNEIGTGRAILDARTAQRNTAAAGALAGKLDPLVVIGKGGGIVPREAFRQGAATSAGMYYCFGLIQVGGAEPTSALLRVNLNTDEVSVTYLPDELAEFRLRCATIVADRYVVPSPNGSFLDVGETLSLPILDLQTNQYFIVTSDPLPVTISSDYYDNRGTVGADGAVYIMPTERRYVMRIDPVAEQIDMLLVPDLASNQYAGMTPGALHPPSGHIISIAGENRSGRVLAIDTTQSPPVMSWISGTTQVLYPDGTVANEFTGTEGLLQLVNPSEGESQSGVTNDIVWNAAAGVFVAIPGYNYELVYTLSYVPGGSSVVRRHPLVVGSFDGEGTYRAIYNAARGSVVILPEYPPFILEVSGGATGPLSQRILYTIPRGSFGLPFGGAAVHGGKIHFVAYNTASGRVLQIPATFDPTAVNMITFYGQS
jgi:hypothetical protein